VLDWVDIAVTITTTGLFALIGFVWRASHKITVMSKTMEDLTRRVGRMENGHEQVMDRMYSIAKDRAKLLTRETYREDSREMSRAIEMAKYEIEQNEKERNRNAGN